MARIHEAFTHTSRFGATRVLWKILLASAFACGCVAGEEHAPVADDSKATNNNGEWVVENCKDDYPSDFGIIRLNGSGHTPIDRPGVYDTNDYCVMKINEIRREYYDIYSQQLPNYVPTPNNPDAWVYFTSNPDPNSSDETCYWCKAMAEAQAGNHVYGSCGNGAGQTSALIGAWAETAEESIDAALESFRTSPDGFGGHSGGLFWDSPRTIFCLLAVHDDGSGDLRRTITIGWGGPTVRSDKPNGSRCKAHFNCTSGSCNYSTGRCQGGAGQTCPAQVPRDCTIAGHGNVCPDINDACEDGLYCVGGQCSTEPGGGGNQEPQCGLIHETCQNDSDCCGSLECRNRGGGVGYVCSSPGRATKNKLGDERFSHRGTRVR
jgi:hypothetical protein